MGFSNGGAISSKRFHLRKRQKGGDNMQVEINGRSMPLNEIGKGA